MKSYVAPTSTPRPLARLLTYTSHAQIKSNEYSLVDFHADWSGPCHVRYPLCPALPPANTDRLPQQIVEKLIRELSEETSNVRFYKVDIDAQQEISKFIGGIYITPVIFVYKAGETVGSMAGANPTGLKVCTLLASAGVWLQERIVVDTVCFWLLQTMIKNFSEVAAPAESSLVPTTTTTRKIKSPTTKPRPPVSWFRLLIASLRMSRRA